VRRSRRGGDFLCVEEVAASAGSLIPARGEGRHLVALAAWRAAVGGQVSRATRVAGLDSGVLRIDVPDRAWGDSLRRFEAEILSRVQAPLGGRAPSRIEFREVPGLWRPSRLPARRQGGEVPRPEPQATGLSPARRRTPPAGAETTPTTGAEPIHESELPVPDAALRATLCRVANRYLRRSTSRHT